MRSAAYSHRSPHQSPFQARHASVLHEFQEDGVADAAGEELLGVQVVVHESCTAVAAGGRDEPPEKLRDAREVRYEACGDCEAQSPYAGRKVLEELCS